MGIIAVFNLVISILLSSSGNHLLRCINCNQFILETLIPTQIRGQGQFQRGEPTSNTIFDCPHTF